jgi:phosphoglucosamine mutase
MKLFGTDGIRGVANIDLTPEITFLLGKSVGFLLSKKKKGEIIIGKDTRISGDMLESSLSAGIVSVGKNVVRVGVLPTPAVCYLVRKWKKEAGCMISASHNPVEDNGIKIFDKNGFKLKKKKEEEIEKYVFEEKDKLPKPSGVMVGKILHVVSESKKEYLNFLKENINYNLKGLKIVIDCANGATSEIAPILFNELNAEVISINSEADGTNINNMCGSLHPEVAREVLLKEKADIAFSFDGDGDRVVIVDEKGNILDGDHILTILAISYKKENKLNSGIIVNTVMSNLGVNKLLEKYNIKVISTDVGDKNVLECLLKKNGELGGEQAGHIIFPKILPCSDGILTSLKVIDVMLKEGKNLSEISSHLEKFPQVLANVKVKYKEKVFKDREIKKKIEEFNSKFKNRGRILVRPSGTEQVVRIMIEGEDEKEIRIFLEEIKELVEKRLN